MRFRYLIEQIYHRPWFMTASGYAALRQTFEAALRRRSPISSSGSALASEETEQEMLKRFDDTGIKLSDMVNTRQPMNIGPDGVARIHILGPMARNLSNLERACGATGFEQIQADIRTAVSCGARGLLLVIDSGGGTVNGTPETAALVAEVATSLPVVVSTADVIGSGAYYIAAGATRIYATPSAMVGSIGVVMPWVDFSEAMKMEGLVGQPITNKEGDLKGAGWITGTFTPAQRANAQEEVDAMFADFRDHVLSHRNIPASAMRGQTLSGRAALDANLIDAFGDESAARAALLSLLR
jgi:signal peptide peptidase SppA